MRAETKVAEELNAVMSQDETVSPALESRIGGRAPVVLCVLSADVKCAKRDLLKVHMCMSRIQLDPCYFAGSYYTSFVAIRVN